MPQPDDATSGPLEVLANGCKLAAGRALTFHARHAGVLSIQQGRVWLTFNNAGQDLRVRAGDHFLSRGENLSLPAGETVVIESYGLGHAPHAYFTWEPAAAASCNRTGLRSGAGSGFRKFTSSAGLSDMPPLSGAFRIFARSKP